jgi:hypothetical protein
MQLSQKMQAALVAGAAVLAAGGFAAALEVERLGSATPTVLSSVSEMTLGDTATPTSPPTAAPVSVAVPSDKADVPCGFTSGC